MGNQRFFEFVFYVFHFCIEMWWNCDDKMMLW